MLSEAKHPSGIIVRYPFSPLLLPADALLVLKDAVLDTLRNHRSNPGPSPVEPLPQLPSEVQQRKLLIPVLASFPLTHHRHPRRSVT
jgi:hypothetical protein